MSGGYDAEDPATARDARLAQQFVSLADTLVDDFDLVDLLDRLVRSCVDLLDVTAAGLLITDGTGVLHPIAASTESTHVLELFQLQNDEGPCLECVRTGEVVSIAEVTEIQSRWPRFARAVAESGFRSVHALPMRLRQDTIGSLNLFVSGRRPLQSNEQRIAQALADVATIGILQQRSVQRASELAEQLQGALESRIAIEQAKGVLAEYGGVEMEAAFDALRSHARRRRLKLGQVAAALVSGDLAPADLIAPRRR
jgi:GAF domain-containing protein